MATTSTRRAGKRINKHSRHGRSNRQSLFQKRTHIERLEERALLASDFGSLPDFRNPLRQFDVNNDSRTTAIDALIILNRLNNEGPRVLDGAIGGEAALGLTAASGEPYFIDTNGDGNLTAIDALLVINKINAAQGEQVQLRVEVTDLAGNPVDTLAPGQDFQLRGFSQDLRLPADDPNRGVYSAYWDVNYDQTRVAVDLGTIQYDPPYVNGHRPVNQITATPGLLDDIGAVAGTTPHGSQEELVFIVPMTATGTGAAFFSLDPEDSELLEVLVHGSDVEVPAAEISFIGDSVTIGEQAAASIADLQVPEGNAVQSDAVLTVTLSSAALVTTTINFATLLDTGPNPATAGEDYVATTGTVSFAVGETTKTIAIPIRGDLLDEPDETFRVVLSAPVGATIADGEAIVTIVNDDALPTITIANDSVSEPATGASNAEFTVTLSNAVTMPVTVQFATMDGTAAAPGDYTTQTGSVTFAPGEFTKTIVVPVQADAEAEGNEDFTVVLSNPTNAQFPGGATTISGTGTIIDQSAARVVVRLEARNAQGEVASVFNVGDEIHILGYVTDASAGDPDDQDGVFQVFTDMLYSTGVVDISSSPIVFGADYPNQRNGDLSTDGIINEIGAGADFDPLGPGEFLVWDVVFIATAEGLAEFQTQFSDRPELFETLIYGEAEAVPESEIQFGEVSVLIGQGPTISIGDAQVTEGNQGGITPMLVPITLSSAHIAPVTVTFTTSNGTAIAGVDYAANTGQITFAPGETTKNATVVVFGDDEIESTENFFIDLSNPINATIADGEGQGIGTILDDDAEGDPTVSINDRVVLEGGAVSFTVSLSRPALNATTVSFATADGTATAGLDYLPATGVLTFAPGEQTQTIVVQTLTDSVADDGETFSVLLTAATGAIIADGTGVGTISELAIVGLSGFVYNDVNRNGLKDAGEIGIPGATVELYGVAEIPGGGTQQIQTLAQTDATGRYLFENLPSGSYSLHEIQPAFFNDGSETPGQGGVVTANDWMFIQFTEGGAASGFNFGEAGIRPQFIGKRMFVASNLSSGAPQALNLANGDAFFAFDAGFSSIAVQALSGTGQGATISVLDNNLNVVASVAPSQAASLSFVGNPMQPYFLRIGGGSSSVTVSSIVLGGPNATGAVNNGQTSALRAAGDELFAGTDDWL
jgi:hypothetical protein